MNTKVVTIECCCCGDKETFSLGEVKDLVYIEDVLCELGWTVAPYGYLCPACKED